MPEITPAFLGFSVNKLRQLTERIETCARMLSPEQVWARGHENENSIGNLVLHLSGNVRQWIVSSLGEKEDHRDRDSEFTARGGMSQDDLLTRLRATIDDAIPLIETCTPEKLLRTYRIQKHEVTGFGGDLSRSGALRASHGPDHFCDEDVDDEATGLLQLLDRASAQSKDPLTRKSSNQETPISDTGSMRSMRPLTLLTPALLFAVNPSSAETGSFTIHLLLHSVGEERYTLATSGNGLALETTFEISDRGNKRTTTAAFQASADYTPIALEVKAAQGRTTSALRTTLSPPGAFPVFGPSPFAVELMLMRYWYAHGKPAHVPVMPRAGDAAGSSIAPLEIEMAGRDTIEVNGKAVNLNRFNIGNLMFGREILWTSADGDLAAAMTFAGGLPMEAIRTEYESALPRLYRSGVAQEMANLAALGRQVPPERTGTYAIAGATLISATGSPALADSVVIVRDGRIEEAGDRFQVRVPRGVPVLEAKGQTLLPGLWEMHTHFSGVEFGPALLAAGITTARDCGGEFEYLIAQRNAIRNKSALSPHLLLAGLVDSGGPKAFGHITAETPDAGRAVVHRYHEAGFQQIKLYTFLKPEVVKAICVEAHLLGMTVTGHVPQAMNAFQGVEAGMDQINHLNYVSAMMRNADSARGAPVDINSEVAKNAIQFFKDHHTVVDPTAGWGEMASHSKDVDVESFEPGIKSAPLVLEAKFRGLGSDATAEQMQTRTAQSLAVVGALHRAGVTIVPGSDTGLVGYGLIRELELYVKAGMSTMEAIQCATIVSARAMHLDQEYGTIERGKRADLILVDGNPLDQISQLRSVSRVIIGSRMFSAAKLWHSVGFSQKMR